MILTPDEKNVIFEYYAALKSHFQASTENGGCPQCDLRLFCHTPVCELTLTGGRIPARVKHI